MVADVSSPRGWELLSGEPGPEINEGGNMKKTLGKKSSRLVDYRAGTL